MIYLARHGETTWNVLGRYQGRLESDLSDLGQRQAIALANYFESIPGPEKPTRVLSSPLRRCSETARFTAERLGLPVETDERLIEIAHGTWEGRLRDELAANDPERYQAWTENPARAAFDGGETIQDVDARWRAFAASLLGCEANVLILSHDAVLRVAILAATEAKLDELWRVKAENGAFARMLPNRPQWTLVEECFFSHLAQERAPIGRQAL